MKELKSEIGEKEREGCSISERKWELMVGGLGGVRKEKGV